MSGIYIHIPFCRSKCAYCDFYSSAATGDYEDYVDSVARELAIRHHELKDPVTTLYIGGGTPSLLPITLLESLLRRVNAIFPLDRMQEVTVEANPEDITIQSISAYRDIGVNRISIGIQSFSENALSIIGRPHSAKDSREALDALATSGINYSADLIYGLPAQGLEQWEEEIRELLSWRPPHFSAYLLSYEPGTKMYIRLRRGVVTEATEHLASAMYNSLCRSAAAEGYEHYEISNFSLPGFYSRHNSSYWDYTPYLGLGAAAHSFDGKIRRINPSSIKKYMEGIKIAGSAFIEEDESAENRLNDYIITSLRTRYGLSMDRVRNRFGEYLSSEFLKGAIREENMGNLVRTTSGWAIPEGKWLTADAILRDLIV